MVEHAHDREVGTAVQRPFQRPDRRGDRRVGIGARRTGHADRKRGVVAAAVFGMEHEGQIQRPGIQSGITSFQHVQKILRDRKVLFRETNVQRTSLVAVAHDVVRVSDDGRELRDQVHRLAHQVVPRSVVGVFVEGIHLQYAAGQDIHDVLALQVEDVHFGLLGQRHALVHHVAESGQFFFVGKVAG